MSPIPLLVLRGAMAAMLLSLATLARAEEVGCTSTTFHLFSPNDKVCVMAFNDPDIDGVTCHISQAKTGGMERRGRRRRRSLSLFDHVPSVRSDHAATKLGARKECVQRERFADFKNTKVIRMFDGKRNTLVYVAISKRVLEGSPMNAISAVPIIPWTGR